MLKAAVSGSFHRHMPAIYEAVCFLRELGVNVLSPADPRIVDNLGEFLFVASDKLRSIRIVTLRQFVHPIYSGWSVQMVIPAHPQAARFSRRQS